MENGDCADRHLNHKLLLLGWCKCRHTAVSRNATQLYSVFQVSVPAKQASVTEMDRLAGRAVRNDLDTGIAA